MDLGSLFLILALLVLVALFISRPFFERQGQPVASAQAFQENHELSSLLAERDRILTALEEMDFDFALGKIPEEDYPANRALLLQRGAQVLRRLDELQPELQAGDVEARIEAAIASRRADAARLAAAPVAAGGGLPGPANRASTASLQVAAPDDDLETILSNRRRARQEKSAGFCPQCGGAVQKSDRFCPKCGTTL